MDQKELERLCDEWLASWTGNRPEKLLEYYTDNAFYADPAFPEGIQGRELLLNYFTKLLRKFPDWKWEREILYPTSEGFSLIWKATIPLKDKVIGVKGMDRIVLQGKKIIRNEVYFNAGLLT